MTAPHSTGLDLDALVAIDVHVHVHADLHGHLALDDELNAAAAKYFKGDPYDPTVHDIAADYRQKKMAAVIFTVDAEAATGQMTLSNEEIADAAAEHPDVLIPFGSIDPARGLAGIRAARRLVEEHGVRGFKFHPSYQNFLPNDRQHYPLYAELEALGVPALFHTGQTGIGSGLPGGRGIKLRYSDPMLLDDVAADFPGLTIIMAHPSVPWQDSAIAVAQHKANVYIDLSGWSPKYFPPQLVRAANSLLKTKVLFGSDYPLLRPERWMKDFAALDIRDEVKPLIMKQNAITALGLR
ncbi:amidohydrolase family protein [Geodermatophilus sp. URMC 62]|uniref:amidohydrolase family protein n=1 Tax=Geodermatophilus sp. URMC 62 TaxID=3423414 RepID=UPI00406C442D